MTWEYRIVCEIIPNGEHSFTLREVYYEDGKIVSWTEEPSEPYGETLFELKANLRQMRNALNWPVLYLTPDGMLREPPR